MPDPKLTPAMEAALRSIDPKPVAFAFTNVRGTMQTVGALARRGLIKRSFVDIGPERYALFSLTDKGRTARAAAMEKKA